MKNNNRLLLLIFAFSSIMASCEKENFVVEYHGELKYEVFNSNINRNCTSIFFLNSEIGYATTQDGDVFKTSNGGGKWNKLNISSPVPLRTSNFVNKNIGYIFGGESSCSPSPCEPFGSIAYKTSNGGKTWQKQNIPYKWSKLSSAYFFDEQNGIAAGLGLCIKTSNGGKTWQQFSISEKTVVSKISFTSQNVGYSNNLGYLYKTNDGGISWNNISVNDSNLTTDFFFVNDEIGYVSETNKLFKTANGGNSWNLIDTMEYSIFNIHFVNENLGVILSRRYLSDDNGFASPPMKHIIKQTKDGGQNWTISEFDENEFNERCIYAKENIIYSLGYDKVFKITIE